MLNPPAAFAQQSALLDTNAVAAMLGLRPNTLVQWRMGGSGPRFVKLGRRVRYRPADVSDWLEKQTRRSTSEIGA
jgi:predicted DNA-binding transcriptional regulator AlpA